MVVAQGNFNLYLAKWDDMFFNFKGVINFLKFVTYLLLSRPNGYFTQAQIRINT